MIAAIQALPWQEIAVMTLFGAAIFGIAIHFHSASCGNCGDCSCSHEAKKPHAPDDEKSDLNQRS